nr:MAG TPA: hypothetical protein [Caudoviricetes sp.]
MCSEHGQKAGINCSQELNSRIWHELAGGAGYEDVKSIYEDVCKLSILSNIAIDAAKKEFVIDSYRELDDIRSKYRMTEDSKKVPDGEKPKTIKPWFFAHIVRQKGFYNPKTKRYTKFKTSMDYLQEAINSYKLRSQRRMKDGFLPFSEVVNDAHWRSDFVNHEQIAAIWAQARSLKAKYDAIHTSEDGDSVKRQIAEARREFYDFMAEQSINKSTMVSLLQCIESEQTEKFIATLFYGLFSTGNPSLYNCIRDSGEPIESILPDPDGDIVIYGHRYSGVVA